MHDTSRTFALTLSRTRGRRVLLLALCAAMTAAAGRGQDASPATQIKDAGVLGGFVVCIGNDGPETAIEVAKAGNFAVHCLVPDPAKLDAVRQGLRTAGLHGTVSAEHWAQTDLPYATHLATAVLAGTGLEVPESEVLRVLSPRGIGFLRKNGAWKKIVKPVPQGMDDWRNLKHGPDGNPVSRDGLAFRKVPNSLRWVNDALQAGSSAARVADGRLLIGFGDKVVARDAFNGVKLWESGVGRGMIVCKDRIYSKGGGSVSDLATGQSLLQFATGSPYEFTVSDDIVVTRTREAVHAYNGRDGKPIWERKADVLDLQLKPFRNTVPATKLQHLVVGGDRVYFTGYETDKPVTLYRLDRKTGKQEGYETNRVPAVFGLNLRTGKQEWKFQDKEPFQAESLIDEFAAPVLYADGTLLLLNRRGYVGLDTTAEGRAWFVATYDKENTKTGKWSPAVPIDARGSLPRAAMCIDGLIWLGGNVGDTNGPIAKATPMSKCWAGFDPKSGAFRRWVGYPPSDTPWSGRCYWDIGAPDCILAQTLEIVTVDGKVLEHVRGVRGQCGMGFIVGHNSVFTTPNVCIYCYPMVRGAVAYELPDLRLAVADKDRIEKGPAYDAGASLAAKGGGGTVATADLWPLYRGGTWRNGATRMELKPDKLSVAWETPVGGRCTQAVVGKGKVVTAVVNDHRVVALNADTGKQAWEFIAGGRVDSSPTLYGDLCVFGSHDGYVYALRLDDGTLVWRFNAAPRHRRIVAGDHVSSPWPVVGSVLAHKGTVYATAGFMTSLDGGVHFWALDPATGKVKFHRELTSIRGEKATIMPYHWHIAQEDMLNNILLAQDNEIRLYDQHGGWELSAETGALVGQAQAVPQPGWPKGRLTPGDFQKVDRWPWCGWDRITMIYLLRGEEPGFGSGVGMDPRNRWADWYKGLYFVFPEKGKTGIQLAKGNLNPIPWALPATLDELRDPKTWRGTPAYKESEAKVCKAQRTGTDVTGMVFAGDTLWTVGTRKETAPAATNAPPSVPLIQTVIHAVALSDGTLTEACTFPGDATFDALSAANGRLFVACSDGRLVCLGR